MSQSPLAVTPLNPLKTYDDALRFLEGLDVSAMKLGLSRVQKLLATLGDPQDRLPMVHIAGTNGKGSVTAMLVSILRAAGYSVGAFTSPHLVHVRERISINGNPVLPDDFQFETAALVAHLEHLGWPREDWPTYFEFLNVMAYQYFCRKGVDITVFETGLGGRLDSTNVVKHPNLTVITSIGLDHMAHLGDTVEQIAAEKAGILKAGTPLVLASGMAEGARHVVLEKAAALDVPVIGDRRAQFEIDKASDPERGLAVRDAGSGQVYRLSLLGPYQKDNLAVVLACVQQLRQQGYEIDESAVREGLAHTYWPVRFQYFQSEGMLLDGSHNADGFAALAEGLQLYFSDRPLAWLISLRSNREPGGLLDVLARFGPPLAVVCTRACPEHLYHTPSVLADAVRERFGDAVPVLEAANPTDGLCALQTVLRTHEGRNPLGVVSGSLYTAGEILHCLERGRSGSAMPAQAQP